MEGNTHAGDFGGFLVWVHRKGDLLRRGQVQPTQNRRSRKGIREDYETRIHLNKFSKKDLS